MPPASQDDVVRIKREVCRRIVPATHFSTATWPSSVTAHTPEAVAASCQPQAFEAALAAAKIEAMTAADVLAQPELARRAWREFQENDLGVIVETPESR